MSVYAQIRALIPDAENAKKPGEVSAALPDVKAQRVRESIGYMFKVGMLDRTGNRSDGFAYYVKRQPMVRRFDSPEEAAEAKRVRDAGYARKRVRSGRRTMTEFRAEQARRKAATAERRQAEREEKRQALAAKRDQERRETAAAVAVKLAARRRRAALKATQTRTKAQRLLSHTPAPAKHPVAVKPVQKPQKVESVAEWMARTGRKVEVLPAVWNQARAA